MVRRLALLALSAALLACPSKVPRGLDPGAFVRIDSLGNPVVEVTRVEDGMLFCRQIPSMAHRRIPLDQIHHVEPVSAALVAQMRSLAQDHGQAAAMRRRLNEMGATMARKAREVARQYQQNGAGPTQPVLPQQLGAPPAGAQGGGAPPALPAGAPALPAGAGGP